MCLQITQPGFLATVQDGGRFGYQRFGIPVAGAMDTFAMRVANRLVGNADDAAVLEIGIQAPVLVALQDCLIAVTGSGFDLFIRGEPAPLWTALVVRSGWEIAFHRQPFGCWIYLALAGGIAVEPVLGSRSTYLRGGFGGFEGRTLQAGDVLYSLHPSSLALTLAGRRLPEVPPEGAPPGGSETERPGGGGSPPRRPRPPSEERPRRRGGIARSNFLFRSSPGCLRAPPVAPLKSISSRRDSC